MHSPINFGYRGPEALGESKRLVIAPSSANKITILRPDQSKMPHRRSLLPMAFWHYISTNSDCKQNRHPTNLTRLVIPSTVDGINSAPTICISNCRDAPMLHGAANHGCRTTWDHAGLTFPGVCWRAVNGRVREQSGDILASRSGRDCFSGTERGVAIY